MLCTAKAPSRKKGTGTKISKGDFRAVKWYAKPRSQRLICVSGIHAENDCGSGLLGYSEVNEPDLTASWHLPPRRAWRTSGPPKATRRRSTAGRDGNMATIRCSAFRDGLLAAWRLIVVRRRQPANRITISCVITTFIVLPSPAMVSLSTHPSTQLIWSVCFVSSIHCQTPSFWSLPIVRSALMNTVFELLCHAQIPHGVIANSGAEAAGDSVSPAVAPGDDPAANEAE